MNAHHDLAAGLHVAASGFAAQAAGLDAAAGAAGMDVLSDVLRSVRLTGSMFFLVEAAAPWMSWAPAASVIGPAVLPRAQHLVSYHVITAGNCWGGLKGRQAERMEAGDILVVPHGEPYFLASPRDAPPSYDTADALAFFRHMAAGELPAVVHEGTSGSVEKTQFICGFLGCDARPFNPVLAALPEVVVLRGGALEKERMRPLVEFALGELRERRPGSQAVLLRLAEVMFVEVVRRHVESLPPSRAGWLGGLRDPVVARALTRLHAEPARAWTLEILADEVGASRSVLMERFAHRLGQPPMHYLAAWRMQLATRQLAQPGARVKNVAEAVGYSSQEAFSRAFKKFVGVAPARWRQGL
jgi:AraC-like DNA-binding protein